MRFKTELIILALAILLAIIYFADYQRHPLFSQLTVDELYHHRTAGNIAEGALIAEEPFFRAPLYSYWLGLLYAVFGESASTTRLIQLLLGAILPLLTYLCARRLAGRAVALLAAMLTLTCSDLLYFQGELLLESLLTLIIMLGWLLWLKSEKEPTSLNFGLLGLLAGLAIITRPNSLTFALVWLFWLIGSTASGSDVRWKRAVTYLLFLALPVGVVLLHNLTREEPAFTLATQGGINFYLGNNQEADGISAVMPGRAGYAWQYEDIRFAAELEAGRTLSAGEISSFYYHRGIDEILAAPVDWLQLVLKKLYLFFSAAPLSNNRDLVAFQEDSVFLRYLPVGMWLLGPLGLAGIIAGFRRDRRLRALGLGALLYAATFLFFFVNSRFRLPLVPILAIFAAQFLFWCWQYLREKRWRPLARFGIIALVLLVLANANLYRLNLDNRAQDHFSRGNFLMRQGDHSGAISEYHLALAENFDLAQLRLNLGIAYLRSGQVDTATQYFIREDSLMQGSAEALNNLSYLARKRGDPTGALEFSRQAFALKPFLENIRLNLWYAWREAGRSDSAYANILTWQRDHTLSPQELLLQAATALDLGKAGSAIATLTALLAEDKEERQPSYAELSQAPPLLGSLDTLEFRRLVHYDLGTAYGQTGQLAKAEEHLRRAVAIDSGFAEGWINLASAQLAQSKLPEAETSLMRAREIGDHLETVHFNLALIKLARTDTLSAKHHLQQSLLVDSTLTPARALLLQLE